MSHKDPTCRFLILVIVIFCLETGITIAADPPKWVTELEFKEDVIETVGYSSEMALPEVSLRRADHSARAEMANVLASIVKSSIRDAMIADKTLDSGTIEVIYEEVTKLYAEEVISGLAIVDHYIDRETGTTYALARLKRASAMEDASTKVKLALGENESLFDELVLNSVIKSRLSPAKGELIEATGYASVIGDDTGNEELVDYEVAMRRAQLNARSALAQRTRVTITNRVRDLLKLHRNTLGESSVELLYEAVTESFSKVKLQGALIMRRYFGEDTKIAYAQAVMHKAWIAEEFSHAAKSAVQKTLPAENRAEMEERIDDTIHKALELLGREPGSEKHSQQQNAAPRSSDIYKRFENWEWWKQSQKQGVYRDCFYGIGSDGSREKADTEALENLAKYMGVTIRNTVKSIFKATRKEVDTSYYERTDIITRKDFYGVIHRHYFQESTGIWYSLAYIPPAPWDISIFMDARVNGESVARGHIWALLESDITDHGYKVNYLPVQRIRKSQSSESVVSSNIGGERVYMAHLPGIMIIGTASVRVRPFIGDPGYEKYTKDLKTAEADLELDVVDTRSASVIATFIASERGIHTQDSAAIRMALTDSYEKISARLIDRIRTYRGGR